MAALLIGLSVMAVLMSAALPVWSQFTRREKEEELIWRGQQYARAIGLFQRKYANTFPPNVDILVEQRFLRKKYKDPITGDDFQVIPATGLPPGAAPPGGGPPAQGAPPADGAPGLVRPPTAAGGLGAEPSGFGTTQPAIGIQGVVSTSKETSIKVFNGRTKYNEWLFVYLASTQGIAAPGGMQPPGAPGMPGGPGSAPGRPGLPGGPPGAPGSPPFGGGNRRPDVSPPAGPGGTPPPPFGMPSPAPPGSGPPRRPPAV